ncbi:MAG: MTH938/NDUFAF3 family protein [Candidatus Methanodesulfokora sp.]|jgi:hypothetical protein|nr:MAG: hypothetical protein C0200_04340 [Candidatus Korarchaeota archaeon]
MNIEVKFGEISINGTKYFDDVIIRSNLVVEKRPKERSSSLRSKYGHTPLTWEELKDIIESEKPEYLVIGTGFLGVMPVLSVVEQAEALGVKVITEKTGKAVDEFVKLINEGRKTVGVFHLTC